jgi:ABC-2 type transport system permease protein
MQFLLFYTIGLLAFWAQEVWGIFESTRIIGLVLSGGVFPLTIFGDKGLALLSWLPFKYIIFFPLEIVTGRLTLAESISGLLIQLSWIALLLLLSHLIWRQGCKKFIALGG